MIKAVIFDMDGVLIDSEIEYLKRDLEFARTKNPGTTMADLFGMVGSSGRDAWIHMERAVNNGQTWEELRSEYRRQRDVFSEIDYVKIFRTEVVDVLRQLKDMGLRIALASSTQLPVIEHVLNSNGVRGYFELLVSGSQFKRSKPDPEIYHYTAGRLGIPEEECLVIEDSTFGVTAASRAGMKIAALIDDRFDFDQSLADVRIHSLSDIPDIARKFLQH